MHGLTAAVSVTSLKDALDAGPAERSRAKRWSFDSARTTIPTLQVDNLTAALEKLKEAQDKDIKQLMAFLSGDLSAAGIHPGAFDANPFGGRQGLIPMPEDVLAG